MPEATAITTRRVPVPEPLDARRGPGADALLPGAADRPTAGLIDALAVAWTAFRVYDDPRLQEPFRRAVATLDAAPAFPWTVEVHSGGFRCAGRPVATRRQAASALARAAFARGIGALGFSAPPTADDLVQLFKVIAFQGAFAAGPQNPAAAVAAARITCLIVVEHSRLSEAPDGLEAARDLVPADESGSAAASHGDPSRRYLAEYRLLYERLQAGDFQGLQDLVHGFTDSFFALPREQQTRLFEQFLSHHEEEPFRLILDQFSQDDLAELAHLLSPGTHPLLVEYARIAAEQDGQSAASGQMLPAEQLVSDRIARLLRSGRDGLHCQVEATLRGQIPGPEANLRAGVEVAAALFALGDEESFTRLARMAATKVAAALGDGDLPRAASWGQAVLSAAASPSRKEVVRREMAAALRLDVFDQLAPALAGPGQPLPVIVTLVALFALDPVVELLAAEEDKRRRRALVDLITAAARIRPGPVVRHLRDPRWYLVRNLVDALAHSGRPEAAAGLRAVCTHADHRVRREARRALPLLDAAEGRAAAIEGLHDPVPALRLQAVNLLRSAPGLEVDAALTAFVNSHPVAEEAIAAVQALAGRPTPQAREALRRLARRRLTGSAATREARRAARRALDGSKP